MLKTSNQPSGTQITQPFPALSTIRNLFSKWVEVIAKVEENSDPTASHLSVFICRFFIFFYFFFIFKFSKRLMI
jgi:hypothetical protein